MKTRVTRGLETLLAALIILTILATIAAFAVRLGAQTTTSFKSFPSRAGETLLVTGANPAAGAEISDTVPARETLTLYSVRIVLVTSATVATRAVNLYFDDGATTFFETFNATTQAASLTYRYNFGVGLVAAGAAPLLVLPLPSAIKLGPGFRIRTTTTAIQVGDDYAAAIYLIERTRF
jgi:hypothetical protein